MAGRLEAQMTLMRAHEAWLQEILDGLPDGVRVIRVADKKVVLANRAFCQQTGRSLEDILERPCHVTSHDRAEPCAATLVICPLVELQEVGATLKASHHHRRCLLYTSRCV